MSIDPYPHHVMSPIPRLPQRTIAGDHLLPGGTGYVTWQPPTHATHNPDTQPGLRKRLTNTLVDLCQQHRAVFLTPLLNPPVDGSMSWLHYTHDATGWGVGLIAMGILSGGIGAAAGIGHASHPASPHPVGTHSPGHIMGSLVGTAFGAGLVLSEFGAALLGGPFVAGTWITGIVTTVGVTVMHAMHLAGRRHHRHILETERIKADTERIFAVAELNTATNGPLDPTGTFVTPGPFDAHPLGGEILRALQIIGVEGASVVQLNVINALRWNATVNLPDGVAPTKVINERDRLQGALKVRNGGLVLTPGEGGHQVIWSVNNIALTELPPPGPHPVIETTTASIWDPIPLGLDDDGHPVTIVIAGTPGILIAGAPGSGKSNASAGIVCTVVRAEDCRLWTIDGSGRELVIFDKVAEHHVRTNHDDAIDMLGALQQELDRRGEILADLHVTEFDRQLAHANGIDCLAYAISELAFFTRPDTDSKKSKVFSGRLADIVARGRACGVFGIFDTQKPEASVVPSAIRDMVPLKMALRCETDAQVRTILGQGMHETCPAHQIDTGEPGLGVAYIKGIPGRKPFRMRTHKITPAERYMVVDQAVLTYKRKPEITTTPSPQAIDDDWDALMIATQDPPEPVPVPEPTTVVVTQHHYPDGTPIPENMLDRWNVLYQFIDGFTWSDLVPLQVANGKSRTSWQNVLPAWQYKGWVTEIGKRGNATLYIRADLHHGTESDVR